MTPIPSPLDTLLRTLRGPTEYPHGSVAARELQPWIEDQALKDAAIDEIHSLFSRLRAERDSLNKENDLLTAEATAALALIGTIQEALAIDRPDAEKVAVLRRAIAGIFAPGGAPREP